MNLWYILPPLLAAVLNLALFFLVLQRRWKSLLHRIFAIFLLNMAIHGLFIFLMRVSPDVQHASTWHIALTPLLHGTGIFFYHFTVILTNIRPKRWVLPAGYLLWVVFAVLGALGFVVTGSQIKPYGYAPVMGPMIGPYVVYTYTFTIMGIFTLIKIYKTSSSNIERNRVAYVIIGVCCYLLGGLTDMLPVLGLRIYPMGIFSNIAFSLLTAVAILRHHLMDIRVIIHKGVYYLLISTIVAIPYTGSALLFGWVISQHMSLTWIWLVILMFIPAIALQPLWSRVQSQVDRLFYRERYDFLKALEEFTEETHSISDLDELATSMVRLTSQALSSSDTRLLLRTESKNFVTVSSSGKNVTPLTLNNDNPVISWMKSNMKLLNSRDMITNTLLQSMTKKETKAINEAQPELFVPISTKINELIGIIVLGKKLNDKTYSQEEERLISSVASRMAVELENARLYNLERTMRAEQEKENKQKTEFLHSIAHEMKTPLTAVMSSSELLNTEISSITPEQMTKLSGNIFRGVSLMDRKITELLELAGIESGNVSLNLEPLDITSILKDISSQFSILFQESDQKFELEVADSMPVVLADREKVEEIIMNLLSNANKYSITGGSIVLRSRVSDNYVIVEIEDTAEPIPDEQKTRLFQPYYRSENDTEMSKVPGLGLGLAICRTLVELHNGKIWIENKNSTGNVFCFSLPIENNS
ncbi:ATP-binding protein [Chloroflexota bacterium]